MLEQIYQISMQTPMGKKHGKMRVQREGTKLRGELDILEHCEPFEGLMDENDFCSISGTFVTLMRTVFYTATGTIDENEIRLILQGERNTFRLSGTACKERGDSQK